MQTGNVRICVAPLAAVKILPRAVARFRQSYPDIDITISSDLFGDAIESLRQGQNDIVIGPHFDAANASDVETEKLFTTDVVVITSSRAKHASCTSLSELKDCYWIMMGDTTGPGKRRFQEQFLHNGLTPPPIRLASE